MGKKKRFIVKVQCSQFPWHESFLTYNEDRSIWFDSEFSEQFYIEKMNSEEKAYFYAHKEKTKDGLGVMLEERAPDQDW